MPTLTDIADELYGLLPAEFTAARNARGRELKDDTDTELAQRVMLLRKPSPAAWGVNLLARARSAELSQLDDLGQLMRQAQSELDRTQLIELTSKRRQVVAALAREAAALASERHYVLTSSSLDEIAATLQAALSDPAAAAAVRSGRLVRSLAGDGVELVDLDDAVAAPEASMLSARPKAARPAPVRDLAAVRAAKEAAKRADDAEAEVAAIERRIGSIESTKERLQTRVESLEQQLAEVEDEVRETDRDLRALARDRDRAAQRAADLRADADRLQGER
jgi:septal ring factor EnvC (AmiA/AmiB activator)